MQLYHLFDVLNSRMSDTFYCTRTQQLQLVLLKIIETKKNFIKYSYNEFAVLLKIFHT